MLAWTAWIQACRSFSDSACSMQLLQTHQHCVFARQQAAKDNVRLLTEGFQAGRHLLGGGHHLKTEPPLIIFTRFDRTQPQILHHHSQ